MAGIQLGQDYPGSAYLAFMHYLKSLRSKGILLAVASKNNFEDAVDVFRNHPDCPLSEEDFADLQINWNDKSSSIEETAGVLNIGLDSMVFLDDNPAEREWVKARIPEVEVLEFPSSPHELISTVENSYCFDRLRITQEDQKRADFYEAEKRRKQYHQGVESLEEFLKGLKMKVEIEKVSSACPVFDRIVQLINRTNQFNLTTRRHSEAEVKKLLDDGAVALSFRVSDKFGEHGVVGVIIAIPEGNGVWRIDTFLLSCRVMMREIESAMLDQLARMLVLRKDAKCLVGEYIGTAKNAPVQSFLPEHGFRPMPERGEGFFKLDLDEQGPGAPDFFEFAFAND